MAKERSAYERIIEDIFLRHYKKGLKSFEFKRAEIQETGERLKVTVPKNLGDVVYNYRYRKFPPESIRSRTPEGFEWTIRGTAKGEYRFALAKELNVLPNPDMIETKIPDATPEIINRYALTDEQSLLAKIRYNRLIDIFTGLTCYSLQNHLRTSILKNVQVETDEVYVGLDKRGAHYVLPVQAKTGNERLGGVQMRQDFDLCAEKFPDAICISIGAKFTRDNVIALFEFEMEEAEIEIVAEKHYRLVSNEEISKGELDQYGKRLE